MEYTVRNFITYAKLIEKPPDTQLPDITKYIKSGQLTSKYFNKILRELDNDEKLYQYMITFTLNSNYVDITSEDKLMLVQRQIIRNLTQSKYAKKYIIEAHIVREGNKADGKRPHWHAVIIAKKYILKHQVFKNYLKKIGKIDIQKGTVKSSKNAIDYFNHEDKKAKYKPKVITLLTPYTQLDQTE